MTQDEKNKIEKKFIAWALARDDDWWQEGHGAVSIWDVRIFIDFASELMGEQKRLILEELDKEKTKYHHCDSFEKWGECHCSKCNDFMVATQALTDYQDKIKNM